MVKMSSLKLVSATTAFALMLTAQSSFAQNFYKWVDAKGSTHYTATPPPKSAQKKGKVETYGSKKIVPVATPSNEQAAPVAKETTPVVQNTATEKEQVHQDAQEALGKGQAVSAEQK